MKAKGQMSESMPLAIFLTLAGGLQDAYSYNCRGKVFANAQTGNIVLLGQNLAEGNWGVALHYLIPLLAFISGVYVAVRIQNLCKESEKIHWRQIVLVIQIILLMSFSCAMQVNAFRKFHGIPCATTMCIGNMRSATEMLCKYQVTGNQELKKKSMHYYFVILVFAVGAAMGALFIRQIGDRTIWIAAILLLAGFVLMFIKEDREDVRR